VQLKVHDIGDRLLQPLEMQTEARSLLIGMIMGDKPLSEAISRRPLDAAHLRLEIVRIVAGITLTLAA
jgi:hypothetical protein